MRNEEEKVELHVDGKARLQGKRQASVLGWNFATGENGMQILDRHRRINGEKQRWRLGKKYVSEGGRV